MMIPRMKQTFSGWRGLVFGILAVAHLSLQNTNQMERELRANINLLTTNITGASTAPITSPPTTPSPKTGHPTTIPTLRPTPTPMTGLPTLARSLPVSSSPIIRSPLSTPDMNNSSVAAPRILVVYSGPTSWFDPNMPAANIKPRQAKDYKYSLNFEYFLEHGVQCAAQDTLIVVTDAVYPHYQARIQQMDEECQQKHNHRVVLMVRQNKCLDLESVRVALYEGHVPLQLPTNSSVSSYYDYFFYINCGVVGPSKDVIANNNNMPWTNLFVSRLRDGVKMTGLSLNCKGVKHVQSMMYAMDRDALQVVLNNGLVFDCEEKFPNWHELKPVQQHGVIVTRYERAMGEYILKAEYGIDGYANGNGKPIFGRNLTACEAADMWTGRRLKAMNEEGRVPYLNETIFFKDTRYLTPELAEEIGYKIEIGGNWE